MRLDATLDVITADLEASFPERRPGPRSVKREAEYPVVDATGACVDARPILDDLLRAGDLAPAREGGMLVGVVGAGFRIGIERGVGTVEIVSGPSPDLHALAEVHAGALARVVEAAARRGAVLLGYGVQPVTSFGQRLLTPRARNLALYEALGQPYLWFTITASDQLHATVDRHELLGALRVTNALACVVIALCGDSPIYGGRDTGWTSVRERGMGAIHDGMARHGMPKDEFRSLLDYVERIAALQWLVRHEDGRFVPCEGSFLNHLEANGPDLAAWHQHRRDAWASGRLRPDDGCVELRAACQQPPDASMAAAALQLGLVEAAPHLDAWLKRRLGRSGWRMLRQYHQDAIVAGLATAEPFRGFVRGVLDRAKDALAGRGRGEEAFLDPLFSRLASRENPADDARRVLAERGLGGLVAARAIGAPPR